MLVIPDSNQEGPGGQLVLAYVAFPYNWMARNKAISVGDTELGAQWAASDTGASPIREAGATDAEGSHEEHV